MTFFHVDMAYVFLPLFVSWDAVEIATRWVLQFNNSQRVLFFIAFLHSTKLYCSLSLDQSCSSEHGSEFMQLSGMIVLVTLAASSVARLRGRMPRAATGDIWKLLADQIATEVTARQPAKYSKNL